MDKQLENKISSREVAEMMEVDHKNLLQKIDAINLDFRELKIQFSKYWKESTYKAEGQTREYKEFQITKRGCEFLANKTTGTKGNLFTDKYMDRFEQMKEFIQENQKQLTPMEILELQFKVVREQGEKIEGVAKKVDDLEDNMPLFNIECKELQSLVRKIGIKALGGYKSQAYNDNSIRGQVYSDIQQQIKREFGVTRYEAIKRSQLEQAMYLINSYELPFVIKDRITLINSQIAM